MTQRRGLDAAFGGQRTTLAEQREIWPEALHPDAVWEGPTFDPPLYMIGREACARFMELLLEVVPEFSTRIVQFFPTEDPDTIVFESTGGGPTVDGGVYEQRYFSQVTMKDGQAFRMREYCNPFQTYAAYGRERWIERTNAIMAECNVPWPESQPADPARLPGA